MSSPVLVSSQRRKTGQRGESAYSLPFRYRKTRTAGLAREWGQDLGLHWSVFHHFILSNNFSIFPQTSCELRFTGSLFLDVDACGSARAEPWPVAHYSGSWWISQDLAHRLDVSRVEVAVMMEVTPSVMFRSACKFFFPQLTETKGVRLAAYMLFALNPFPVFSYDLLFFFSSPFSQLMSRYQHPVCGSLTIVGAEGARQGKPSLLVTSACEPMQPTSRPDQMRLTRHTCGQRTTRTRPQVGVGVGHPRPTGAKRPRTGIVYAELAMV